MNRRVVLLFAGALACSRPAPSTTTAAASATAAPSSSAPIPSSRVSLGDHISAPLVPLAEIAAHPALYADKTVATSGKVTAVCQMMGCWMELADASGRAHVRMHGHAFFVPRTSSGRTARVQAKLVGAKDAPAECADQACAPEDRARLELDATGVEID